MEELLSFKEASEFATEYLNKNVTISNISYLIQYGRIPKIGDNGSTYVSKDDLIKYYESHQIKKEANWKEKLGKDLNWRLSFSECKEAETTKHVHRLHPYKGKFIPQLVEYFLDEHIDNFKTESFFHANDIVLDPFCGSGTTLVQANELGIHAIGIDISAFNSMISNTKINDYNISDVYLSSKTITQNLRVFLNSKNNIQFEQKLLEELKKFNDEYFPSPDYKYRQRDKNFDEKKYGIEKEKEFLNIYHRLINEYKIQLKQGKNNSFLDKWFLQSIRDEINFLYEQIESLTNLSTKKILTIVLSRTIRSCRATTHADLATLFEPVTETYYCKKHGKICKPLFTTLNWWKRYCEDTIDRIQEFQELKTKTIQYCITADSRNVDLHSSLEVESPELSELIKKQKIKGVFSSPPYIGLIDYHEQHAYSYDLFNFQRNDDLEIGRLYHGQGIEARKSYIKSIAEVLLNVRKYLVDDFNIFLVANDKYGMYSQIAELANMKIFNQYKRPVLNRVEKDRSAYSEIIFHLKSS